MRKASPGTTSDGLGGGSEGSRVGKTLGVFFFYFSFFCFSALPQMATVPFVLMRRTRGNVAHILTTWGGGGVGRGEGLPPRPADQVLPPVLVHRRSAGRQWWHFDNSCGGLATAAGWRVFEEHRSLGTPLATRQSTVARLAALAQVCLPFLFFFCFK